MKKDIGIIKIHCFSEALSPITHMGGTAGNEAILNKEKIFHDGNIKSVPVLSGNAIRHRAIRETGSMFLVDMLDLKGKLTIDQANYMFYGGSLTESTITENMKAITQLQELFPLYRLLGGSLRNQIVQGSLICQRGIICCEENKKIINSFLPKQYKFEEKEFLKTAEDFIRDYQYTRGDAQKRADSTEILSGTDSERTSNLMIYNGQTLVSGTLFYHGFILNYVSRKEVGALMLALQRWQHEGGIIGGFSRIGHGRLKTEIIFEDNEFCTYKDIPDCIQEYIDHVQKNKDNCIQWMSENFPEKCKKNG